MKNILIFIAIGFTAMLLLACQTSSNLNKSPVAENNVTNKQSDEQSKKREIVSGLREFLYCDKSLDQVLASMQDDDPSLSEAIAAIQRGSSKEAESKLNNAGVQQKLRESEIYWLALAKARELNGNSAGAKEAVLRIVNSPTETRWKIQAWSVLRELSYKPNDGEARTVLGVVVETGMDQGYTLIVAGYADGEARMLWTDGGGLLGPMEKYPAIVEGAKSLVKAAEPTTAFLPIESSRPYPATGRVRFAILTPAGMHVADEKESDVKNPNHRLHEVYMSMHRLLTPLLDLYSSTESEELPKP